VEGGGGGGGVVEATPAPVPLAAPMIAPGTHPTPRRGAVTAAPIPHPTAAPPTAPSVAFVPGLGVHAARANNVPAVTMVLIVRSPKQLQLIATDDDDHTDDTRIVNQVFFKIFHRHFDVAQQQGAFEGSRLKKFCERSQTEANYLSRL
jgi:hypothetical protein